MIDRSNFQELSQNFQESENVPQSFKSKCRMKAPRASVLQKMSSKLSNCRTLCDTTCLIKRNCRNSTPKHLWCCTILSSLICISEIRAAFLVKGQQIEALYDVKAELAFSVIVVMQGAQFAWLLLLTYPRIQALFLKGGVIVKCYNSSFEKQRWISL